MSGTRRLTMAQALVEFLADQHSERDGKTRRLFAMRVLPDPLEYVTVGGAWWDVAVAEVSTFEDVRRARADYERSKQNQWHYL